MALRIVECCVNCSACEPLCPSAAIHAATPYFVIDPAACDECLGHYDDPQCASICPIEGAIVDEMNLPLNPPGSLTGITPEMRAGFSRGRPLIRNNTGVTMAVVVFYEKPGCSGNAFQKALLEASGHTVVAKDILKTDWMRLQLLPFLKSLPVSEWFNRSAPLVRSGAIDPDSFDASDATSVLSLLIDQPLLIHRPLLEVDGVCRAGFNPAAIHAWIGLSAAFGGVPLVGNPEACRHGANGTHCPVQE